MRRRRLILATAVALLLIIGAVFTTFNFNNASATTIAGEEYKKAIATSLATCYNSYTLRTPLKAGDYDNYTDKLSYIIKTDKQIKNGLPGGYVNLTDPKCSNILKDALSTVEITLPKQASDAATALTKMGYTSTASSEGMCFNLQYDVTLTSGAVQSTSKSLTKSVCIQSIDNNGVIQSDKTEVNQAGGDDSVIDFSSGTGKVNIDCWVAAAGEGGCGDVTFTKGVTTWEEFRNSVHNKILASEKGTSGWHYILGYSYELDRNYGNNGLKDSPYGSVTAQYDLAKDASDAMVKSFFGYASPLDDLKYSDAEKFTLYQNYLVNYYKIDALQNLNEQQIVERTGNGANGGYQKAKVYSDGEIKECYIKAKENSNKSVGAVGQNGLYGNAARILDADGTVTWTYATGGPATIDFNGLVSFFQNTSVSSVPSGSSIMSANCHDDGATAPNPTDPSDPSNPSNPSDPSETPSAGEKDKNKISDICLKNSGAESLSWVACPTVGGMAVGSDGLYANIKDMLKVDISFLDNSSSAYEIWGYFRDFANTIFALAIIAVIVSQVTGYGIDNYGIKKMLPRLIVTAILVNLSFVICQLAVDLSNIVGNSVGLMLSSFANSALQSSATGESTGITLATVIEGVLLAVGGIGGSALPFAITAISVGVAGWGLILIIIMIVLLLIVVAALVAFLMLGARQILVIVAVAISPIAFICYALPNTEKLFKKWWDIFKAALLVFPICSLLSGMGQIVQSIVYGTVGSGELSASMVLVAAACPFLPFFALPSLLKSSLKAVGDIGNKLSGLNAKAYKAASSANQAIRNSDAYKDAQFQTAMARNQKRLDKINKKDESQLSDWQKRRKKTFERRALAYQKAAMERDTTNYDSRMAALAQEATDKEIGAARTLLTQDDATFDFGEDGGGVMAFNYRDDDQLWAAYQHARGKGDYTTAKAIAEIAGRDKSAAGAFIKNMRTTGGSMDETMAKFITGSKSAGNFRAASGLGFEYIQQMSRGQVAKQAAKGADGSAPLIAGNDFSHWVKNKKNVQDAVEHHITNASELYGQKGGELQYLRDLKNNGGMNDDTSRNIAKLAYQAQLQASNTGTYDATKDDIITELRKGYTPAPGEAGTITGTPEAVHVDGAGNPIETGHEFEEGTVVEEVPDSVRTARASAEAARATSEAATGATASGSSSESNVINYVESDAPASSAGGTATSGTSASSTSGVPRRESASVTHGSGGTQGTTSINGGAGTSDYLDVRGASAGTTGGGSVSGVNQVQNVGPRNAQTLYYAGKHTDIDRALRDLNYVAADGSGGTTNPSKALLIDTGGRPLSTNPNPTPAPGVVTPASTPAQPASPAPQSAPQAPVQPVATPQTQQPSAPSGSPSFVRTDAGTGEPRPGRPRVTLTPMDSDNSAGSQLRPTSSSDQGSDGHNRGSDGHNRGSDGTHGSGRNPRHRPSGPRRSK